LTIIYWQSAYVIYSVMRCIDEYKNLLLEQIQIDNGLTSLIKKQRIQLQA